jgi:hypothetical protein
MKRSVAGDEADRLTGLPFLCFAEGDEVGEALEELVQCLPAFLGRKGFVDAPRRAARFQAGAPSNTAAGMSAQAVWLSNASRQRYVVTYGSPWYGDSGLPMKKVRAELKRGILSWGIAVEESLSLAREAPVISVLRLPCDCDQRFPGEYWASV